MSPVRFVTPSLFLGQPNLPGTTKVTSSSEALGVILGGGIAVLPEDAVYLVPQVLGELGVSGQRLQRRMGIAKTGSLL